MGDKEWSPASILDIFGDSIARATLIMASEHAVTVPDIADRLGVSPPTVYRRIDPLVDANLLEERLRVDEAGKQPKQYETILDEVTLSIEDGSYTVDIQVDQDIADDFESMWADLESTSTPAEQDTPLTSTGATEKRGDPS